MFDIDWNKLLDDKLNERINELLHPAKEEFSVEDLDIKINDDETLREYIIDSEKTFLLEHKDLDSMSTEELTEYVNKLDRRWFGEILY